MPLIVVGNWSGIMRGHLPEKKAAPSEGEGAASKAIGGTSLSNGSQAYREAMMAEPGNWAVVVSQFD
jgi:hypothetical protein